LERQHLRAKLISGERAMFAYDFLSRQLIDVSHRRVGALSGWAHSRY
jgi:hypothetical protein